MRWPGGGTAARQPCLALAAAGAGCLALSGNFFPWDALYALGGAAQRPCRQPAVPVALFGTRLPVPGRWRWGLGLQLANPRLRAGAAAALCLVAAVAAAGQLRGVHGHRRAGILRLR